MVYCAFFLQLRMYKDHVHLVLDCNSLISMETGQSFTSKRFRLDHTRCSVSVTFIIKEVTDRLQCSNSAVHNAVTYIEIRHYHNWHSNDKWNFSQSVSSAPDSKD